LRKAAGSVDAVMNLVSANAWVSKNVKGREKNRKGKSMKRLNSSRYIVCVGAVAVAMFGARVYADTASDIESFYPVGSYAQYDNTSGAYPLVTAIGSQPGTFGGKLYTSWSVFAQDSTGSLEEFITASTLTTLTANASASISVGDAINIAGQWSPFHAIPELGFVTTPASNNYFNTISHGNAVPAPTVYTVSALNQGNAINPTIPEGQAGYYLQLNNVTISSPSNGLTALPGYTAVISNETFTITDNTGSMTMFDWTTSFSAATQLAGTPIGASNHYNVEGLISVNPGGPMEFTALAVQAIPEPSSIVLVASGLIGLLTIRRRRA
jgi:PEP-CTERM motif